MMIFKTEGFVHTEKPEHYKNNSSFLIEEDFSSLTFEFFGEGKPLYFHVTDPEGIVRVQYLSSENPVQIVLHQDESKSGIGTCPGEIKKGEWQISVFTFGARSNSRFGKVSFTVKVFNSVDADNSAEKLINWIDRDAFSAGKIALKGFEKSRRGNDGYRWLKGDFHVHSNLSDGSSSPVELIEEGLSKKLDFFFITEHNILSTGFPEKKGITVFPSYEVTTVSGHFNLPGLRIMPEDLLGKGPIPDWKDIKEIMSEAENSGALVSINHPAFHPWQWLYYDLPLSMVDSIEVVTDPYDVKIGDTNEKAVKMLDLIWNAGYRIAGIGGSDTHTAFSDSQLGQPVTEVYAKPGSLRSLLEGVKNCHAAVYLDSENRMQYSVKGETVLPGTDIESSEDVDLEIIFTAGEDSDPFNLRIIENGVVTDEMETIPGTGAVFEKKWDRSSDWIRCEMRDAGGMLRGYLNPLHRGGKETNIKTWGEIIDLMD